jgi:hypothetical protein
MVELNLTQKEEILIDHVVRRDSSGHLLGNIIAIQPNGTRIHSKSADKLQMYLYNKWR